MTQKITILKVDQTKAPKGYSVLDIAYKAEDGKTKAMKVVDFTNKAIFETLAASSPGEVFDVTFVKNDKGYWSFGSVTQTGEKASVAQETTTKKSGGTWETSEERAARQVLIVRQSCLANAIAYAEMQKVKTSAHDVVHLAETFKEYVFNGLAKAVQPQEVE